MKRSRIVSRTRTRSDGWHVYVVDLDPRCWSESRSLRSRNRQVVGRPVACVYVGTTGLGVSRRVSQHVSGRRSNGLVRRYGRGVNRDLTLGPFGSRAGLRSLEVSVSRALKALGYAVWRN